MSINSIISNLPTLSAASIASNKNNPASPFGSVLGGVANSLSKLGDLGVLGNIETIPPKPTTGVTFSANLSMEQSVYTGAYNATDPSENMTSGAVQPDYMHAVTVIDSKGNNQNFYLSFLKTAENTWSVEVSTQPPGPGVSQSAQITSGTVTFNPADATLASVSPSLTTLNVKWPDATTSNISLNLGTIGRADGLGQFEAPYHFAAVIEDGQVGGKLTGFNIQYGQIYANYSNGVSKPIL